jgi:hypothetical protein
MTNTKQLVLDSIKPILEHSKYVSIDESQTEALAERIHKYPIPGWDNTLQFLGEPEQTALYYFFLDSINFCFWAKRGQERWSFQKEGQWLQGYYAYSYAIKKWFENNPKNFEVDFLTNMDFGQFGKIFEGRNELLLLEDRYKIISENFGILKNRFGGSLQNMISGAEGDVNKLVEILISTFPSFRDSIILDGHEIFFLKRAQIFASDLYYSMQGQAFGKFRNMDALTIFSDYKLPQLLEAEGVLRYTEELKTKIKDEELIPAGSEEELEIRSNTIFACEFLLQKIQDLGRKLNSNELDWILWVAAKETKFELPHHKTLTINY